jgi:hypothetical protein
MLAGTLQLSRALTDRQLADQLLEQGIRNALALLDAEQHDSPPDLDQAQDGLAGDEVDGRIGGGDLRDLR